MIRQAELLQIYSINSRAQYTSSSLSPHDHDPPLSLLSALSTSQGTGHRAQQTSP